MQKITLVLAIALFLGACGLNAASTEASADAAQCPDCPTCPTCPACAEAILTVQLVNHRAQTAGTIQFVRQGGSWSKMMQANPQEVIMTGPEPSDAEVTVEAETALNLIKANPNNVGSILVKNYTWQQRGKAAVWSGVDTSEGNTLIFETLSYLQ